MMIRAVPVAIVLLGVASSSAMAGVTVDEKPGSAVTLTIENASVDAALTALRERYGFEVEGLSNLGSGEVLNVTLSGSLPEVVARLLRNWNYVVVKSEDAQRKIRKVVIINTNFGTAATKTESEKAAAQQIENAKKAAGEF